MSRFLRSLGSLAGGTLVLMVVLSGTTRGSSVSAATSENGVRTSTVSVTSCTSGQTAIIETAVADATGYLANATEYFDNVRSGSRFTSWFGTYDVTRWNEVKSTFQNMEDMVVSGAIDFDCDDSNCGGSGTFGYVYPSDTSPYTVHLCGAFWTAPATGTDSRAGTLIHEWSHFNGTGATVDHAYGKTGAGSLALGNPGNAVNNADNYEYFAENDPNTVDNSPVRTVSTSSHDFGSVPVGTSSSAFVFTVTNSGDGDLVVASLVPTSTFTLASDTCSGATVAPSASCSFGVVFSPSVAGSISGSLTVYNNSGAGALVVALTGSATSTTSNVLRFATTGANPRGIAIDDSGNVYTANTVGRDVTKVQPNGTATQFAFLGGEPKRMLVDGSGNLLVVNQVLDVIHKIDPQGGVTSLGATGPTPFDVALDSTGAVVTASTVTGEVTRISSSGAASLLAMTSTSIQGVAIDPAGNIFATDFVQDRVLKIFPDGSVSLFASVQSPFAIVCDPLGNVYVAGLFSSVVTKITPNGTATNHGTVGSGPYDLAFDSAGNLYSANVYSDNVSKIAPDGTVSTFGVTESGPNALAIDSSGNVFVANDGDDSVTKLVGASPAPPRIPSAPLVTPGFGSVTVTPSTLVASARYGSPTSYVVRAVNDPSKSCVVTLPATSCAVSDLTPGVGHAFTVSARLNSWETPPSPPSQSVSALSGGLVTLTPSRVINTRPTGKIGNRTGTADPMIFNVYGQGGLPSSGIDAVVLNVTAVDPEVGNEGGFLTVYPCASGRPDASNLNFVTRQIIANTVIAPVDGDGNICFYSYGQTHVLADVSGYFPSGSSLRTLTPSRVINTRPTDKIGDRTGTADPLIFNVYGKGGLPSSGIDAVLLNVTAVDPEVGNEGGFLTVYPCASGRPDASNLNFTPRQIIANTVVAPVDPSGNICIYSYGQTHVLADVSGYFPS